LLVEMMELMMVVMMVDSLDNWRVEMLVEY